VVSTQSVSGVFLDMEETTWLLVREYLARVHLNLHVSVLRYSLNLAVMQKCIKQVENPYLKRQFQKIICQLFSDGRGLV